MTLDAIMDELARAWPDKDHVELLRKWRVFSASAASEPFNVAFEKYLKHAQPFCEGGRVSQDMEASAGRRMDLIGGAPYTSGRYPWPRTADGKYWMQPVLQLSLANAGELLQRDLGADTLQIWGPVGSSARSIGSSPNEFLMRLIPADHFAEPPTVDIPNWQSGLDGQGGVQFAFALDESDEEAKSNGRIWRLRGPMYGPALLFWEACAEEVAACSQGDEFSEWIEQLFALDEYSEYLSMNNGSYLGGVGGQSGGINDCSSGDGLLARISDGQGLIVAVHAAGVVRDLRDLSIQISYYV
jgi:hypothetical protein